MDPETQSITSKCSQKTSRHKEKWCSVCGQKQERNLSRHKETHPGQDVHPLEDGEEPSEPFCTNWRDVRYNEAEPENPSLSYLKGKSRSKIGKSVASRSVASLSEAGGNGDEVSSIWINSFSF